MIGGNSVWNEFFAGTIDDLRIYNRALSAAEIQADMNTPVTTGTATDTTAPTVALTAPANGATLGATVAVTATAADSVGVSGVQFLLDGALLGAEDTVAPYAVSWNTLTATNGSHVVTARARDAAGNLATATAVTVTVNNGVTAPAAGLMAAYGFNEGSGTSTADNSARGHTGSLSNAAWTAAGHAGSALTFNGSSSWVAVPDSPDLDLTTGLTLEAWLNPTSVTSWRTVVLKEGVGELAYALYANDDGAQPILSVHFGGTTTIASSPSRLAVNTWSHLAATYDGVTERLFVNGVQVGTQARTGAIDVTAGRLMIGGNSLWNEFFAGTIDDLRIYNRALSAAEIQADMNTPVTTAPVPDTTAPTVALTAPANGATVAATVSVTATATDSVGVSGVQFLLDGAVLGAEDTVAPYAVSWNTLTTTNGSHVVTARARDAAGNLATSTAVTVTVTNPVADTTAPTVALTAPANGATLAATVAVTATAADSVGVSGVQFLLDGALLGAEDTVAPYAVSWNTLTTTNGSHVVTARARDAAGNLATAAVTVTISNAVVDIIAPTITATSPASGATGVSLTTAVTATFSELIDATSITATTVTLRNPTTTVTGSVSYSGGIATFTPSASLANGTVYTATVKSGSSGVKDLAGNPLAADRTWSFTTVAATGRTCPCSIWTAATVPGPADSDRSSVELGLRFQTDTAGYITGLRFYKYAANTGTHVGSLWTAGGVRLTTVTFVNETASGWQLATFASPVAVVANTTYVASYHTNSGAYAATNDGFAVALDNAPLHVLSSSTVGGNGVYQYGAASVFPTQNYQSSNYWVDVIFNKTP